MPYRNNQSIICTLIPNSNPSEWVCIEHSGAKKGTIVRRGGVYYRPEYIVKTDETIYHNIPEHWIFQVVT